MTYQDEQIGTGFPCQYSRPANSASARKGTVANVVLFFLTSVLIVAALGYCALILRPDARRTMLTRNVVRVYCASSVAQPVEKLIEAYHEAHAARVELTRTGGSGELFGQIKTEFETGFDGGADLFVTADEHLLEIARAEGIVTEVLPVARQRPVIAIASESSLIFNSLQDLVGRPGIKFGIASERAAVGRLTRQIASRDGFLHELESHKATDSENVMTLAQALVAGSLDAAIVWDSTVTQVNQQHPPSAPVLRIAALADRQNEFQANIAIGVVSRTQVPADCLKFARYVTAPETARATFERFGFSFVAKGMEGAFIRRANSMLGRRALNDLPSVEIDKRARSSPTVQRWAKARSWSRPLLMHRFFDTIDLPQSGPCFHDQGFRLPESSVRSMLAGNIQETE
jgi:ABC-type molybdate transport system substrate-binding protein